MRPCGTPTSRGPCARPAGHLAGRCLDVDRYANAVVEERRRIGETADRIGCIAHGRGMRGLVVLTGPAGLRRSVWSTLSRHVDQAATRFGKRVAEVIEMQVSATKLRRFR
jgi:hypothetical protein